jgi:hypothetical protein
MKPEFIICPISDRKCVNEYCLLFPKEPWCIYFVRYFSEMIIERRKVLSQASQAEKDFFENRKDEIIKAREEDLGLPENSLKEAINEEVDSSK